MDELVSIERSRYTARWRRPYSFSSEHWTTGQQGAIIQQGQRPYVMWHHVWLFSVIQMYKRAIAKVRFVAQYIVMTHIFFVLYLLYAAALRSLFFNLYHTFCTIDTVNKAKQQFSQKSDGFWCYSVGSDPSFWLSWARFSSYGQCNMGCSGHNTL